MWLALVDQGNGISAYHLVQRQLHRREQVEMFLLLDIFYQLHQHLGIGVRTEGKSLLLQFLFQVSIILDDTVMDNGQIA